MMPLPSGSRQTRRLPSLGSMMMPYTAESGSMPSVIV